MGLKDLRLNKGLKLEELAEQTGISKSALGSYEKDDYKEINHGNLILLADFYGVSLDYLFCRTENRAEINTPLYGFTLGKLLIQQAQADLTGADDGHQLFKLGHLSRIGRLVPQYPHMMGQPAAVNIVRPFAQEVEHLRKGQRHKEIVGAVRVADAEKSSRPAISHAVKLQLVIGHDLPKLGNIKGSKPSAAGDQNAFGRLARDEKSRTFSSNSRRSHILRTSSRSIRLILSSIVSFAVSLKWTRTI